MGGLGEGEVGGIVGEDEPDEPRETIAERGKEGGDIGGQAQVDGDGIVILGFEQGEGFGGIAAAGRLDVFVDQEEVAGETADGFGFGCNQQNAEMTCDYVH